MIGTVQAGRIEELRAALRGVQAELAAVVGQESRLDRDCSLAQKLRSRIELILVEEVEISCILSRALAGSRTTHASQQPAMASNGAISTAQRRGRRRRHWRGRNGRSLAA